MPRRLLAALASLALLAPVPAAAQDFATLIADRVQVIGTDTIIAEGNVEVFHDGIRLTAPRVRYERAGERLFIDGPITLTEGDRVAVLADSAELDADLRTGILLGAQMVLDHEVQLASPRIDRVEGGYVQLRNAVATSCRVCASNRAPIWEIRANRVIHDRETRQIYFEGAQFRLAGVPLAYLPRFRMPDPTVDRQSGVLAPRLFTSTLLSTGIQTPYFLTFGPHADVVLTPWVSDVTRTLEARYRQRFRFGDLNARTAVSDDTIEGNLRAFLFADWSFRLPGEYTLSGDLELVSDTAYLRDYGFSNADRLDSSIALKRTNAREDIFLELVAFRTLRGPDLAFRDQTTARLLEGRYETALPTGDAGGTAWLRLDTTAILRPSTADIVGRDVARFGAETSWRADAVTFGGLVAAFETGVTGDLYFVADDPTFSESTLRTAPYAALDLRWPFQKSDGGVSQLIEPALFVAWSETFGGAVPNEDSTLIDFDDGNLLALSRFPGSDRLEEGLRGALAMRYEREDRAGWSLGATVGRVFWSQDPGINAGSAGLSGTQSDWLLSASYSYRDRFRVMTRSLFEDLDTLSRSETRLDWQTGRLNLGTIYTYAEADLNDRRLQPTSEWTLDARYRINENWSSDVDWRYNETEQSFVDAGLGVRFENECVRLDLSLSRDFTSSATIRPVTDFTFAVAFGGYGDRRSFRRSCTG